MGNTIHTGIPLDEALSSPHAATRAFARMGSSRAQEELLQLINAEVKRPDVDYASLLHALAEYFIQIHASVAAQLLPEGEEEWAAGKFKDQVDRAYAKHFVLCVPRAAGGAVQ